MNRRTLQQSTHQLMWVPCDRIRPGNKHKKKITSVFLPKFPHSLSLSLQHHMINQGNSCKRPSVLPTGSLGVTRCRVIFYAQKQKGFPPCLVLHVATWRQLASVSPRPILNARPLWLFDVAANFPAFRYPEECLRINFVHTYFIISPLCVICSTCRRRRRLVSRQPRTNPVCWRDVADRQETPLSTGTWCFSPAGVKWEKDEHCGGESAYLCLLSDTE